MRPLSRNRRIAVVLASCAAIVPGTDALLSQTQISSFAHTHDFLNGLAIGLSLTFSAGAFVFLRRDRSACNRILTPGA